MIKSVTLAFLVASVTVLAWLTGAQETSSGAQAVQPDQPHQTIVYVGIFKNGSAWLEGKEIMEQPDIHDHIDYLAGKVESGEIIMAGPFLDNSGGMVIYNTQDEAEAKKLAMGDPAVKSGLLECTLRQWYIAMGDEHLSPKKRAADSSSSE